MRDPRRDQMRETKVRPKKRPGRNQRIKMNRCQAVTFFLFLMWSFHFDRRKGHRKDPRRDPRRDPKRDPRRDPRTDSR